MQMMKHYQLKMCHYPPLNQAINNNNNNNNNDNDDSNVVINAHNNLTSDEIHDTLASNESPTTAVDTVDQESHQAPFYMSNSNDATSSSLN